MRMLPAIGLPLLAGMVAAFGGAAQAQEKVVFALNWVPYGLHYGIFAAKEQGYYRDAKLDVEIQRGYGSGDTVKRVATGTADIGMADAASVIVGRGNGLAVKQIASVLDRSGDAIFYVKGIGIAAPKDLPGHTLGAALGETGLNLLPVFAKGADIDAKRIEIINLAPPAKFPSLVSKKVDSILAFTVEEPVIQSAARKAGVELGRFLFSDYGVDYYSVGLIASDETLAKRPEMVKKVADATMRGYAWAIKNPEGAADAFAKSFPESSRELMLAQWKVTIGHMLTEQTRANGIGYLDQAKMARTLELIKQYQEVKGNVSTADIYSMNFLSKIPAE